MGLLDDAKSSVSKWFEGQVAKNKAFKAAGGMGKSNPAMTRSMGLLPATGLLEQEGDAAARADAAYGALRKEYGPLGLRPGDFVPFASGGLAIDDARLAAAKGNYGQAAGSLAGVIPVAGAVGKVVRKITGGKSSGVVDSVKREISDGPALSVGKAAINRFETEADRRMAAAQRNAALPFEQGGLGLPAGNTPMQRARAMGFNTARGKELYHSTRGDLSSGVIDPAKSDLGFHVGTLEQADNRAKAMGAGGVNYADEANIIPLMSSKYANMLRVKDEGSFHADALAPQLEKKGLLAKGKGKQIASAIDTDWKEKGRYDQQMRDVLAQNDYDGVSYKNQQEGDGTSYAFTNPSQLRSRFAAFDPMRRNESDLLALNGQKTGSGLLNPEITKATNRGLYRIMLDDEEDKPSFPYGLIGK